MHVRPEPRGGGLDPACGEVALGSRQAQSRNLETAAPEAGRGTGAAGRRRCHLSVGVGLADPQSHFRAVASGTAVLSRAKSI